MTKNLKKDCFHCEKPLEIKYIHGQKRYSHKNDWGYWTENEEYKGSWICDDCLVKLYRQHKWEFHKLVQNKKKQAQFRIYLSRNIIIGKAENIFITNSQQKKKKTGVGKFFANSLSDSN